MILGNILSLALMVSYGAEKSVQKTAQKPVCDANAVTRNCDFFRERSKQSAITFPDGSSITNPLYIPENNTLPPVNPSPLNIGYGSLDYDKYLYNQAEIIDALEDTSFSTRFKIAFANLAGGWSLNPDKEMQLPWPPEDKNASKQLLKRANVEAYLKEHMSEKEFLHLQEAIKAQAKPFEAEMAEQQRQQEKRMEEDKKLAENAKQLTELRNKKKLRIKELFKYAQDSVIEMIRRGKKDSDLTSEERIFIRKVQTIEMTDLDSPRVANSTHCSGLVDNAFYLETNHTINVCPGQVMKPDGELVFILAHEIGHSIDPCYARMPLSEIDQVKLNSFLDKANPDDKATLLTLLPTGSKMSNIDLSLHVNNPKELEASGAFKKIEDGIEPKKYPFKEEYNCFVRENFFRENTAKDVGFLKDYMRNHAQSDGNQKTLKRTIDRYARAIDKYPQCLDTFSPVQQMGEVLADMVGSVVAEKYAFEHPFKSEEEKVAMIRFSQSVCGVEKNQRKTPDSYAPKIVETVISSKGDEHPDHEDRVKKIILNLPGMAKIYDCRRTVPACFDHLSFSKRMANSQDSKKVEGEK